MKIIISDPLPTSATKLLETEGWTVDARSGRPAEELANDIADADALIVRSATKVTSQLIASAPQLRVIARAGSGVDNVDLQAASERGILVLNAPGANSISVAEHAFALIMSLARSIPRADAQMKNRKWEKKSFRGVELRGKVLGVIGLGRIGRELAHRARAFDMTVVAHDPFITTHIAQELGIELLPLSDLAKQSDFISLHLPSTETTKGMVDAKFLNDCKADVRIVNTARGDLIDESALTDAINNGQIGGAGLDVYAQEPPTDSALTGHVDVVATPHIAGSTTEAQELVGIEAATSVREYLRSGVVRNAVNYPSVGAEEFNRLRPYLLLVERMGSLLAQLADSRISGMGIRYYGDLAQASNEMLVGGALVGMFQHMLSSSVSLVNARSIAEQRGLEVIESRSTRSRNFTNLVSLKLQTETAEHWAEGAVFEPGQPRLVRLDDVEIEMPLEGTVLVIRNSDQPGVIGEVGTVLGRYDVNIATFALGRSTAGAIGAVRVGSPTEQSRVNTTTLPSELLDDIREIGAVQSVHVVKL